MSSPQPVSIHDVIVKNFWYTNLLHLIPSRLELSRLLRNPGRKRATTREGVGESI